MAQDRYKTDDHYGLQFLEELGLYAQNANIFTLSRVIEMANSMESPIVCQKNWDSIQFIVVPAAQINALPEDFTSEVPKGQAWKKDVNSIAGRAKKGPVRIETTQEADGDSWTETDAVIMSLEDWKYWEARKEFDPRQTANIYGPIANFARGFADQAKFREIASEGCMIPSERDNSKTTVTISQDLPKKARHVQDITNEDAPTQARIIAHAFDMARKNGVAQTLQLSNHEHPTRFLNISVLKPKV